MYVIDLVYFFNCLFVQRVLAPGLINPTIHHFDDSRKSAKEKPRRW